MSDNTDFKELLNRYKSHTATPEETARVEAELEKFELINDYLCEALESEASLPSSSVPETSDNVPEQFAKMVRRSIRRAFWKLGFCVLAAVMAVMLFVQFGLSPLMDRLYYDPTVPVGKYSDQISLDTAVYTDLRYPLGKRDTVSAVPLGYGRYSLTFHSSFYFSGMQRPETVAGELSRNRLTLYNADVFRSVPVNLFACYSGNSDQWVTTPEYAREQLETLADGTYYTAYLSFEEDISFTEYLAFEEKADIDYSWFPVRTEESVYFHNGHIGMSSNFSGACIEGWDDEKYPWLFLSGNDPESAVFAAHPEQNEQIMTTHLLSQLRYLSAPERETFLSFFGERSETFASAYEYIEAHGLSIYGSVFYATKDQLLKISEMDNVYGIYVQR